uniref:Uncharacterized protein n=1 Tax=Amphora coffeiformis TaxID=265554 RepID=A0A7S3P4W4_9STRA
MFACEHGKVSCHCCVCIPYKELNALCPALTTLLLIVTNVMTIPFVEHFPGVALNVFVFGNLSWILFVSIFFFKLKPNQESLRFMITSASGLIAGIFYLFLGFRLRRPWLSFDIFCNPVDEGTDVDGQDYNGNLLDEQDDECTRRREQIAILYLSCALVWIVASIQLFVFAWNVKTKLRIENAEREKQVEDSREILQLEGGELPPTTPQYQHAVVCTPPVVVGSNQISRAKAVSVPKEDGSSAQNATKSSRQVKTPNMQRAVVTTGAKFLNKMTRGVNTDLGKLVADRSTAAKASKRLKATATIPVPNDRPRSRNVTRKFSNNPKDKEDFSKDTKDMCDFEGQVRRYLESPHRKSAVTKIIKEEKGNVTQTFSNTLKGEGFSDAEGRTQQQRRNSSQTPRKSTAANNVIKLSSSNNSKKYNHIATDDKVLVLSGTVKPKKEKEYDEFGSRIKRENKYGEHGNRIKKKNRSKKRQKELSESFTTRSVSESDYSMDATESTASSSCSPLTARRIIESPTSFVAAVTAFAMVGNNYGKVDPTPIRAVHDNDSGDYESDYEDDPLFL